MGAVKNITRRAFLISSVAVGGGVAFGTYLAQRPLANPLADAEGASFNPWVHITSEKITLITPHADKGQGIASAQAALIAEELDVEFGQFDIDFGEPNPAYYNTAIAEEGVPFMSTDESVVAETMRGIMGGVIKIMGMQGTGGSSSVPDSFVKLRNAGAVARETLKLAASQQSGVPVDQLETANGMVKLPDGTKLAYTDLASVAATIEPVQKVTLREPSEWRLIGKPMQRLDILGKSTGALEYGIDAKVDGMVHATVIVNPCKGAPLKSFDAEAAKTMRGVQKILPVTNGIAVVADNTWRAIQAANAIEVEWEKAPYPDEQGDHWAELEASFTPEKVDSVWRDDGDVTTASGESVEASYRSPYVAHQPLEPMNAIVLVNDDQVDVWTGHQMPIFLTQQVAEVTGHSADQIVFHNFFMGGSFGHRLEFDYLKQTAEIAKEMPGVPVKMTYSREVDFAQDFPRHIAMGQAKGTHENGQVTSIDLSVAAPSVIGSQMSRIGVSVPGADSQISAGAWNNPYKLDNFRMTAYRAPELAPTSSWRSVGAPGAGFMFDTFLDEMIHAAGADPMEERIRLMDHEVSRKVLEAAAEMSDWGSDLPEGTAKGVAFVESFGVPTAQVVQVTNTDAGIKIDKVWCASDVGVVIDPVNFENLVQGGIVFGLGHAMNCEITYSGGMAEQTNYHAHEGMRIWQTPEIMVKGLQNGHKVRGIGEPPVPVAAPALGNAIFAATGQRLREMPFNKFVDFV